VSSASRWSEQFRQDGQLAPKPSGGDHASHRIEAQADLILTTYKARPAILLLSERVCGPGRPAEIETACLPSTREATWIEAAGMLAGVLTKSQRLGASEKRS
jgi:hypothetical protein